MLSAAAELERQSAELRSSGLTVFHQLAVTMQHRAQQLRTHAELLLGILTPVSGSVTGVVPAAIAPAFCIDCGQFTCVCDGALLQELEKKAAGLPRDAAA